MSQARDHGRWIREYFATHEDATVDEAAKAAHNAGMALPRHMISDIRQRLRAEAAGLEEPPSPVRAVPDAPPFAPPAPPLPLPALPTAALEAFVAEVARGMRQHQLSALMLHLASDGTASYEAEVRASASGTVRL